LAVKVRPSEFEDSPVVPPEEETNRGLEQIRNNDKSPKLGAKDILRRELHQRRNIFPLLVEVGPAHDIDRDQDTTADDGGNQKDVPDHAQEAQEQDCIEPDFFYEIVLLDLDGVQPSKRLLVQRQRPVLLVGMFGAGGIDTRVSWAQEAEDEEEEAGDGE
jgi:hypothetical protein